MPKGLHSSEALMHPIKTDDAGNVTESSLDTGQGINR